MMGLRPRQGNPKLISDYLSLMLGKPRIRLNNLKTSQRFPCLGLNPIIDSIIPDTASATEAFNSQFSERQRWDYIRRINFHSVSLSLDLMVSNFQSANENITTVNSDPLIG